MRNKLSSEIKAVADAANPPAMLTNPPSAIVWSALTNGTAGATNYWTNSIAGQHEFFRLYAPTN